MLKRMFAVVVLAVMLAGANAGATILEIPLPDLLGPYPLEPPLVERTASFVLPVTPFAINSVSFRLAGTTEVGELMCESGGSSPWPMDFSAWLQDPATGRRWYSFSPMPEETGPFAWTDPFHASPPSATNDWSFLHDGVHELTLYGAPAALVGLCSPIVSPTAEVTEAVLVIDAEFPVRTEPTTWGRVKALFRAE